MIMEDLNSEACGNCLNGFCNVNSLKTLNTGQNCFKNPNNPWCIDLFSRNWQQCFLQTCAIDTGFSDFQMVVIVMKIHYKKQKAKTTQYRNYKHFHEQSFNFEIFNIKQWVAENLY